MNRYTLLFQRRCNSQQVGIGPDRYRDLGGAVFNKTDVIKSVARHGGFIGVMLMAMSVRMLFPMVLVRETGMFTGKLFRVMVVREQVMADQYGETEQQHDGYVNSAFHDWWLQK